MRVRGQLLSWRRANLTAAAPDDGKSARAFAAMLLALGKTRDP
jgi:hypothetical protein